MAAPPAANRPQRIMSLTVCTDELLMDLVPPSRIASISYLSREKAALKLWPEAARHSRQSQQRRRDTGAESRLDPHPGLCLDRPCARCWQKAASAFVEVPQAENFDQIRAVTRLVGDAVGERPARRAVDRAHGCHLARTGDGKAASKRFAWSGWGGGGFVPGGDTLFNAVLEAAGGRNIAEHDSGYYDVESLIAARPDVAGLWR